MIVNWNKERLLLYGVTDRKGAGSGSFYEQIEAALRGGATMIQLREKGMAQPELIETARRVKALCRRWEVPLIVNDDAEAALAAGADGVHVGAEDAPVAALRQRCGAGFIIGATAKTVEQARAAEAAGADYLGVGAVFPSPTKKGAIRITVEQLKEICGSVAIPVVAIGGISLENVALLRGSGVAGIAVVSALFGAADIGAAAAALKKEALRITGSGAQARKEEKE